MIIDGQAEFRSLLMHHVTTHWPDAIISAYDPVTAGRLPDEFSGAGNDLILLGDQQGKTDPMQTLATFTRKAGFPPVIFFGNEQQDRQRARNFGAGGFFDRERVPHQPLVASMDEILRSRRRIASTDSLFVGDMETGIYPLIKGFRLIEKLAVSEHSAVYLAVRESADTKMVLKVLRQAADSSDGVGAFDRFLQEYEIIADINHPNIVRIFDLGVADDHAHIAMEYLDSGALRQRIEAGVSAQDAVRYTAEIASALASIHAVGILHRDLKPGNIMLRSNGSIALIDFGLAKRMRLAQEITDSGKIFGTPYYMSPEQGHADQVDARSDIYSLGVIFYEMLTGEKPFLGSNAMSIILKHAKAPIPLLPHHLAEYQALLNMMLAKKPVDRLQKAEDVVTWLS